MTTKRTLLESFPTPPSFIPPSPNPPPSLPPSSPLPPVPGPSPISEHFLSCRRASKLSVASDSNVYSRSARDSVASNRSAPVTFNRECIPASLSDIEDNTEDEAVLNPSHVSLSRFSSADESISSIDMRDLPAADDDNDIPLSHAQAQALHRSFRSQRSRSNSHRKSLLNRSASSALPPHIPPLPSNRSTSPDIPSILSSTPKPRRISSSSSRFSKSGSAPVSRRSSDPRSTSPVTLAYDDPPWHDNEFQARLEKALEPGSDSDSSIDLYTPLPHLMVRHGLLSPYSKLLPQSPHSPRPPTVDGRPPSTLSVASSTITKSGVIKDERDTPSRRSRHRDGRLLKGGIGLTTGLGWSDSEDEDAPSPLTRRLSTLNLSRRSSASSMRPSTSTLLHPLSRSYNGPILQEGRSSKHPPTSWQSRARSSTTSVESRRDLALSIPEASAGTRSNRSASEPTTHPEDLVRTPSTASSTASIPLTPDTDKVLPPLPPSAGRRYPSTLSLKSAKAGNIPRPLQLPQAQHQNSMPLQGLPAPARAHSVPSPGGSEKPKPRTGTGMVYRTGAPSRMRLPSVVATRTPVASK